MRDDEDTTTLMRPKNEKAVCDFIRKILSVATGADIEVTGLPDRQRRSTQEVEELWASPIHQFAIEHTLLESFVGQLDDDAKFMKLFAPLEPLLVGRLPGTYVLQVEAGASSSVRARYQTVWLQIAERILEVSPSLDVGAVVALHVEALPFAPLFGRRDARGSKVIVRRRISEIESSRLDRVRRALAQKCPKLANARGNDRISILALESNDIALANFNVVGLAVKQALLERKDCPDIVMHVETDGGSFYAWLIENRTDLRLNHTYNETSI